MLYPANSKGDFDIFKILISPISNFFIYFYFSYLIVIFFYWQINTYLHYFQTVYFLKYILRINIGFLGLSWTFILNETSMFSELATFHSI